MNGMHITEAILDACLRGELSSDALLRRTLRHLQSQCEVCHKEMARWRRKRQPSVSSLGFLRAAIDEQVPPVGDEVAADRDLMTLLPLEVSEREQKVKRAISRFRSPLLARALAQEARVELGHDLEEATNLVKLALLVLEEAPRSNFSREIKAHALALQAMTFKAQGDLAAAADLFKQARALVSHAEIIDLILAGELDEMEGSFLKDRRQLQRAEELLQKALLRYQVIDERTRQARVLLVLATVRFYQGDYEKAICDARRVLELAPEHQAYGVMAAHAIALYLTESGRPQEAAHQLKQNEARYKEAEGVWRLHDLHFHWLAGKISHGLGRYKQAEGHLTKARDGFLERGTVYDTVLVCLDLALVYEGTDRHEELMQITSFISGELAEASLHEEAATAVTLFLRAAAKRTISEKFVRQLGRFLQFSRTDPTLKCELSLTQFK